MAASEPEDPYSHTQLEEEYGGPTKSFLEHLEDLRWLLMKCGAVTLVTFITCLAASPLIVKVLVWPLEHTGVVFKTPKVSQHVTLLLGTNRLGSFEVSTNQPAPFGTNEHTIFELAPVQSGSNWVLGLQVSTNELVANFKPRRVGLVNLGPASAFYTSLNLGLYGGLALASPFILLFVGQFVFPALRMAEKKYAYYAVGFGTALFALGILFCYFILLPLALSAAIEYAQWMGFDVNDWRAEEYIDFVSKCLLGMGVAFESPMVILLLVKIGILNYQKLSKFRMYMVVVNLVAAGILTPGADILSQLLMFFPLQFLYEVSLWITWYWEWRDRKKV